MLILNYSFLFWGRSIENCFKVHIFSAFIYSGIFIVLEVINLKLISKHSFITANFFGLLFIGIKCIKKLIFILYRKLKLWWQGGGQIPY